MMRKQTCIQAPRPRHATGYRETVMQEDRHATGEADRLTDIDVRTDRGGLTDWWT